MKRQIRAGALILVLALVGPGQASAQTTLSFRSGVSSATFYGADVVGTSIDSRTGLNVGALLTFGLGGNLGIQVGGAYVQKGYRFRVPRDRDLSFTPHHEDDLEVTVSLDYIEMPVLLRLGIPTSGSLSPHFFLGPAVSIEAGCSIDSSNALNSWSMDCVLGDVPERAIDLGGMAGAGLDIATSGSWSITLDVLYNLGLTSLDDSTPADDVKNRAWSILAGVSLPIG